MRWQSTLLLKRHAPLLESEGHGGTYSKVDPKLYGPRVSALYWHVDWHDTWEPEEAMHNQPESATLFEAYMPMAALKQARMEMRSDLQLTNLQKQGHGHKAPNQSDLSLSRQPELAAQICINTTNTVDRDRDLEGTGQFHLQEDQSTAGLASVHSPTGAFLSIINMTRLQTLQTAYAQAEGARPPFAEAVATLLARYKDTSPTESSRRTKISNHWATPDNLMTGLIQSLSLTTERFASPLNFSTSMSSYYAVNQEDQAFGANFDAFSTPWLGASQANPEYEDADMDKAVRWAIMSAASTEEASLTAFILPEWPRTAYYKYMTGPRVHHFVTVPKDKFRFKTTQLLEDRADLCQPPKMEHQDLCGGKLDRSAIHQAAAQASTPTCSPWLHHAQHAQHGASAS